MSFISRMAPFSIVGAVIRRSYRVRCSIPSFWAFPMASQQSSWEENLTAQAVTAAIQPVRPPFPTRPAA